MEARPVEYLFCRKREVSAAKLHIETIVALDPTLVAMLILFLVPMVVKTNKFIDHIESIVIGRNQGSNMPHVPCCRKHILLFAFIYCQIHLNILAFSSTEGSSNILLGTPYDVNIGRIASN